MGNPALLRRPAWSDRHALCARDVGGSRNETPGSRNATWQEASLADCCVCSLGRCQCLPHEWLRGDWLYRFRSILGDARFGRVICPTDISKQGERAYCN